jgi:hypothetical protein
MCGERVGETRVSRRVFAYAAVLPVILIASLVVGLILVEIHFWLADVHEALAYALLLVESGVGLGLLIFQRVKRRRRRLEAPPT